MFVRRPVLLSRARELQFELEGFIVTGSVTPVDSLSKYQVLMASPLL